MDIFLNRQISDMMHKFNLFFLWSLTLLLTVCLLLLWFLSFRRKKKKRSPSKVSIPWSSNSYFRSSVILLKMNSQVSRFHLELSNHLISLLGSHCLLCINNIVQTEPKQLKTHLCLIQYNELSLYLHFCLMSVLSSRE